MTNKEIIEQALLIAELNGYSHHYIGCKDKFEMFSLTKSYFSHSFAKAFWGETSFWWCIKENKEIIDGLVTYEEKCDICGGTVKSLISWQYHLQQMVLEENPLKYLEKFL